MFGTPPNNGMHLTADTNDFIFHQSRGAAGDAGRYVAPNMRSLRFWIPIILSIPATLFCGVIAAAAAGVGHGSYLRFEIFFPHSLLLTALVEWLGFRDSNDLSFIIPVLAQFPLYGLAAGVAVLRGKLWPALGVVLGLHLLAVLFLLMS